MLTSPAGRPLTVSVIVPVFNDAAYLSEALESVFAQTLSPDQVVVVDDGSTDGSAEVAARFPVTLVRQANQGIGAARNAGLAAVTGEVIGWLDADDLWPLDSLRVRIAVLDADAAAAGAYGLTEHFLTPELSDEAKARFHLPEGQTAVRFAGAMVIRRQAYDKVGGFDPSLKVGETMDWLARFTDSGLHLALADTLVMRRRIHGDNSTVGETRLNADYLRLLRASVARKAATRAAGGLT